MNYFVIYLVVINIIAFVLYGLDKFKARRHGWRIPEALLLLVAAIGGSLGSGMAMLAFRHKTRKPYFKIGIPLIIAGQILLFVAVNSL